MFVEFRVAENREKKSGTKDKISKNKMKNPRIDVEVLSHLRCN